MPEKTEPVKKVEKGRVLEWIVQSDGSRSAQWNAEWGVEVRRLDELWNARTFCTSRSEWNSIGRFPTIEAALQACECWLNSRLENGDFVEDILTYIAQLSELQDFWKSLPPGETVSGYERVQGTWLRLLGHTSTYRFMNQLQAMIDDALPDLVRDLVRIAREDC